MRSRYKRYAAVSLLAAFLAFSGIAGAATLQFSGYTWEVRSGDGGPGPCHWSESNAWVDDAGQLHLKLSKDSGTWSCAEVSLAETHRLGFGVYQFEVIGAIDTLDRNVVLGMFNYPPPDVGPDSTNEIDVEIARWGNPSYPNLNFTAWPTRDNLLQQGKSFEFSLDGTYTTHRFTWRSNSILFQSLNGHRDDNQSQIARWKFVPKAPRRYIPQRPLPVHINLWLFEGNPPADGREVEIVVSKFSYHP
jgi:hypothetical protein